MTNAVSMSVKVCVVNVCVATTVVDLLSGDNHISFPGRPNQQRVKNLTDCSPTDNAHQIWYLVD